MKRVCHMTSVHGRKDVRIFEKECCSLAEIGYDVTLVVADGYPAEEKNAVRIVSAPASRLGKLGRMFITTRSVYKLAVRQNADIYHLHDPELLQVALRLKKKGKTVIFDAHEDTEKQMTDKKKLPKFIWLLISKGYHYYSFFVMKRLDAVITVTPHLVDKFSSANKNTVMVTNYPILSDAYCISYEENLKDPYICFTGGVTRPWNHDIIIDSLSLVPGVKYKIAGRTNPAYLEMLKSKKGWEQTEYLGVVSHSQASDLQKKSIVGMAVNYSSQVKGEGTLGNTKLFEYMASGIPVICTNYRLWKQVIGENKCGICVDYDSPEQIADAIRYLIENPKEAADMGKRGRSACEKKFNWDSEKKKLFDLYKSF